MSSTTLNRTDALQRGVGDAAPYGRVAAGFVGWGTPTSCFCGTAALRKPPYKGWFVVCDPLPVVSAQCQPAAVAAGWSVTGKRIQVTTRIVGVGVLDDPLSVTQPGHGASGTPPPTVVLLPGSLAEGSPLRHKQKTWIPIRYPGFLVRRKGLAANIPFWGMLYGVAGALPGEKQPTGLFYGILRVPFSAWQKPRYPKGYLGFWYAERDSNPRPTDS